MFISAIRLVTLLLAVSTVEASGLDWEITNRFRSFDFLGDQNKAAQVYEENVPKRGENDFIAWHKRIVTQKEKSPYSPFSEEQGPWDEKAGVYDKTFVELPETVQVRIWNSTEFNFVGPCELSIAGKSVSVTDCLKAPLIITIPATGGKITLSENGRKVAEESIEPRLKIIVGMGDSYGAGEGAPDQPVQWHSNITETVWPLNNPELVSSWVKQPANWYSNRCNRSFFSAQSMTALALSRDDPHSIVSFVHLSCAGAEILDGLLAQQRMPPGHNPACEPLIKRKDKATPIPSCDVGMSQFQNIVDLLCREKTKQVSATVLNEIKGPLGKLKINAAQLQWVSTSTLSECGEAQMRKPDLVLISIGGNDVGFSGVIAWGLIPTKSRVPVLGQWVIGVARGKSGVVCPDSRSGGCTKDEAPSSDRIRELSVRYKALEAALRNLLFVRGESVVLTTYTDPVTNEIGELCGDVPYSNVVNNAWYPTRMLIPPLGVPSKWQINLTSGETKHVRRFVVTGLNDAITATSERYGWTVPDVSRVMDNRGWCAGPQDKIPHPGNFSSWDVHENHTRMIQTSADSAATQWPPDSREDWLSGTFHPNVWGYAGIATEMYRTITSRGLLSK